jgi:molybdopterin synthase catalytic subunit
MIRVHAGPEPLRAGDELDRLTDLQIGAVASFIGVVRGDGGLVSLTLDHYPAMTARSLTLLAERARSNWTLTGVTIVHRTGTLYPKERIVFVGTASAHRAAALAGCAFLIDALKTEAPFWKREAFADGRAGWVSPRDSDAAAAARWDQPSSL